MIMDYFKLIRTWFDFAFENPERIKPNHIALYTFCVEHCNRLGWKKKFGLPTEMAKDAIGIKCYKVFIKTLRELVEFGFIRMIEKSKNQYSSNIIALVDYDKALDKALDKASIKHRTKHTPKQVQSTPQSIPTIIKHITLNNYTIIQVNKLNNFLNNFLKEKNKIEYPFNSEIFLQAWDLWKQFKKQQFKFVYKSIGEQGALKDLSELSNHNEDIAVRIIHQSIKKGWKGFFKLDDNNIKNSSYENLVAETINDMSNYDK